MGQMVHHRMLEYRVIIYDVDPVFGGVEEWYEHVARSRRPKNQPWHHVRVGGLDARTHVAERHLEAD